MTFDKDTERRLQVSREWLAGAQPIPTVAQVLAPLMEAFTLMNDLRERAEELPLLSNCDPAYRQPAADLVQVCRDVVAMCGSCAERFVGGEQRAFVGSAMRQIVGGMLDFGALAGEVDGRFFDLLEVSALPTEVSGRAKRRRRVRST